MASQDTEITLGTGKLLLLFFTLVGICALFFALGYTLGRKSEPAVTTASAAMPQTVLSTAKPVPASAPPMTFYKAVEQKDANPELTPAPDTKGDASPAPDPSGTTPPPTTTTTDSATLPSSAAYFVQVAAVSKQEDAGALVDALKKKSYPAFVAAQAATDKLFRVQVGPFSEVKDAEAMRTRLIADGYSPILKR